MTRQLRSRSVLLIIVTALVLALFPGTGAADETAPELLVLGDSYSAGEGLAPYDAGTDDPTAGVPDTCHRSSQAYGRLAAQALGFRYRSHACSGAHIADLDSFNADNAIEEPQTRDIGELGPRDAVALTIGGNDADWTGLLASCTRVTVGDHTVPTPGLYDPQDCQRRKDGGNATVESIATELAAEYRTLMQSTNARIYVLLYPPMIPARAPDATKDCSTENLAEQGSVGLSADTSHRMVELEMLMNQRIRETAAVVDQEPHSTQSSLHVVDIEQTFGGYEGHTISCGFSNRPTPWINALRFDVLRFVGDTEGEIQRRLTTTFYTSGSFHPTAEGQRQMATALVENIRPSG